MHATDVPAWLRRWFVMHFAIDMVVAVPLFFFPREVLSLLGWMSVDPMAARVTAAAFFAIGLESFFGRNASREKYIGMLRLKLVWSAFSTLGLAWAMFEGALRYPLVGWALVGVFAAFHLLWWYWLVRLTRAVRSEDQSGA
jgi:hypothetical protein